MNKNCITLEEVSYDHDYVIVHDDGRDMVITNNEDYPALAMTYGWSPCAKCSRVCKRASDGTIDCSRRSASEHIEVATEYLDSHIGKRVCDLGYFDLATYPCDPDLIRAIHILAFEHHSGQWSRGYRLLCRVQQYSCKHDIDLDRQTSASQRLYIKLAAHYGSKL